MTVKCPRCAKNVVVKEKKVSFMGKTIDIQKQSCPSCYTEFYFEEQISAYIQYIANSANNQTP